MLYRKLILPFFCVAFCFGNEQLVVTRHGVEISAFPEIAQKALMIQQRTAELGLQEKQIVALVCSYNSREFVEENIISIARQKIGERGKEKPYQNWLLVYCDDCSSDGQYEEVLRVVSRLGIEEHCVVIKNPIRYETYLANYYRIIHQCPNDAIIACIDGDDSLAHEHVFDRLNREYQNADVWMTYGNYFNTDGIIGGMAGPYSSQIVAQGAFRKDIWRATHLKTFYAWLFKKVGIERLRRSSGKFFHYVNDVAPMLAMLELAGSHSKFIKEILYRYNVHNPLHDAGKSNYANDAKQEMAAVYKLPQYKPLQLCDDEPSVL